MPAPYRIMLVRRSATDLERIFAHIANDSPRNASRMVERIRSAIEILKAFPHRTIVRQSRKYPQAPVRLLPVESYIVFFRVFEAQSLVRVVRVRHGAQRMPKRFDD